MAEITGYDCTEIERLGFCQALFPDYNQQKRFKVHLAQINPKSKLPPSEWQISHIGGSRKTVVISLSAFKTSGGMYVMVIMQDVKRHENLPTARRSLEDSLQQAKKMEAIAALAGGIAHEFNNALSVISGHIDLLAFDLCNHNSETRSLTTIQSAVNRMTDLTGQLLAYAQGGKYQPKAISANTFLEETLSLTRHLLKPNIEVKTEIQSDMPYIQIDLTQMQMVLSAVLSNAMEAVYNHGRIFISAKDLHLNPKSQLPKDAAPGHYVCFAVNDNGPGMDAETRQRIFEPFFSTKVYGRGLGMAAAYGIVKNHGGWIGVDSTPGQGTHISIYLPALSKKVSAKKTDKKRLVKGSGTILVVESDATLKDINRILLEKIGYHVLEAANGEQALSVARNFSNPVDVAIIDLGLPDIPGVTLFKEISILQPNIKIIACSGQAPTQQIVQFLKDNRHSFIQKPFSFSELSARLDQMRQLP